MSPDPAPKRRRRSGTPLDRASETQLEEIRLLTKQMREHQAQITKLGLKRRDRVLKLRAKNVTYNEIAEAMGTTSQSVYKVIRGDL